MSRIVISNEWWKKSVSLDRIALERRDYDEAAIHYHRSFTEIETMYSMRRRSDVSLQIDLALYIMYFISCYNLADAFEFKGEYALAQKYTELAFKLIGYELRHNSFCFYHQQAVVHNYQYALDRLTNYLRFHGYCEEAISRQIDLLSRQTPPQYVHSSDSFSTARDCHSGQKPRASLRLIISHDASH